MPARAPWKRRAVAALALAAICAVVPLFVNDAIGYVPLGLLLCMVALSAAYLRLTVRAVGCTQAARRQECVRGEANDLTVSVVNRSPFVLVRVEPTFCVSLEGEEPRRVRARAALAPHEEHRFGIDTAFDHVGSYEVGLECVEVFDLVGLFSRRVRVDGRCAVRVVPRIHPLGRMVGSDLSTTDVARSVSTVASDDRDYASVRDYQLGDPMKTVHWKMSARGDERLYTKLFESHANPATTVLLGFRCTDADPQVRAHLYDTMLEAVFSLLECARRSNVDASLVFSDRSGAVQVARNAGTDKLAALIDTMPRLSGAVDPRCAASLLDGLGRDRATEANLVFCAAELEGETVEALVRQRQMHRSVRVLLATPPNLRSSERAARLAGVDRLEAARIPVTVLTDGADIAKGVRR